MTPPPLKGTSRRPPFRPPPLGTGGYKERVCWGQLRGAKWPGRRAALTSGCVPFVASWSGCAWPTPPCSWVGPWTRRAGTSHSGRVRDGKPVARSCGDGWGLTRRAGRTADCLSGCAWRRGGDGGPPHLTQTRRGAPVPPVVTGNPPPDAPYREPTRPLRFDANDPIADTRDAGRRGNRYVRPRAERRRRPRRTTSRT